MNNFSGLQMAVEEQVGQTTFAVVREQTLDDFPQFTAIIRLICERLSWFARLWQRYFLWP
jgi:hypothetical protein